MKVKMIQTYSSPDGVLTRGRVYDLPGKLARAITGGPRPSAILLDESEKAVVIGDPKREPEDPAPEYEQAKVKVPPARKPRVRRRKTKAGDDPPRKEVLGTSAQAPDQEAQDAPETPAEPSTEETTGTPGETQEDDAGEPVKGPASVDDLNLPDRLQQALASAGLEDLDAIRLAGDLSQYPGITKADADLVEQRFAALEL